MTMKSAPSAISEARTRLGEEPLAWLFGRTAREGKGAQALESAKDLVKRYPRDARAHNVMGIAFASNIEAIRQFIQSIIGTDLFSAEIYFLTQVPARIDPHEVAMVLAMAFGLSFLATIYPSGRAARLEPVEALRYE